MSDRVPIQRESSEDSLMALGLIAAIIVGGGWLLWHRYHEQIALGVIAVQHWQMRLIGVFTDRYRTLDAQALALDPA
jgi:hypothetical protein